MMGAPMLLRRAILALAVLLAAPRAEAAYDDYWLGVDRRAAVVSWLGVGFGGAGVVTAGLTVLSPVETGTAAAGLLWAGAPLVAGSTLRSRRALLALGASGYSGAGAWTTYGLWIGSVAMGLTGAGLLVDDSPDDDAVGIALVGVSGVTALGAYAAGAAQIAANAKVRRTLGLVGPGRTEARSRRFMALAPLVGPRTGYGLALAGTL